MPDRSEPPKRYRVPSQSITTSMMRCLSTPAAVRSGSPPSSTYCSQSERNASRSTVTSSSASSSASTSPSSSAVMLLAFFDALVDLFLRAFLPLAFVCVSGSASGSASTIEADGPVRMSSPSLAIRSLRPVIASALSAGSMPTMRLISALCVRTSSMAWRLPASRRTTEPEERRAFFFFAIDRADLARCATASGGTMAVRATTAISAMQHDDQTFANVRMRGPPWLGEENGYCAAVLRGVFETRSRSSLSAPSTERPLTVRCVRRTTRS